MYIRKKEQIMNVLKIVRAKEELKGTKDLVSLTVPRAIKSFVEYVNSRKNSVKLDVLDCSLIEQDTRILNYIENHITLPNQKPSYYLGCDIKVGDIVNIKNNSSRENLYAVVEIVNDEDGTVIVIENAYTLSVIHVSVGDVTLQSRKEDLDLDTLELDDIVDLYRQNVEYFIKYIGVNYVGIINASMYGSKDIIHISKNVIRLVRKTNSGIKLTGNNEFNINDIVILNNYSSDSKSQYDYSEGTCCVLKILDDKMYVMCNNSIAPKLVNKSDYSLYRKSSSVHQPMSDDELELLFIKARQKDIEDKITNEKLSEYNERKEILSNNRSNLVNQINEMAAALNMLRIDLSKIDIELSGINQDINMLKYNTNNMIKCNHSDYYKGY